MRFYRKIIRICAEDSPNVKLGLWQYKQGKPITDEIIVPGVLSFREYLKRRQTWDKVRQRICLDGYFYEGAEVLLYPPEWLDRSERLASRFRNMERQAKGIGIDPAEGGDKTAMVAVDELGVIEVVSKKTPDTSVITGEAIAFMRKYGVPPGHVMFDQGGGGRVHADRLRLQGFEVGAVAFGESVSPLPRRGIVSIGEKMEEREEKYVFKNRRAQMYGTLRELLDPSTEGFGFGIPSEYPELRRQLAPMPLMYDPEGRLMMLPKRRKAGSKDQSLTDILGCSPDEADALVLAIYGMLSGISEVVIGAL